MGSGHGLRQIDHRPIPRDSREAWALIVAFNESIRLPAVLGYHRKIGIGRFLVVDNGSTDGSLEYLLGSRDVHVFQIQEAYRRAKNGMAWLEQLLDEYAEGRWCLVIDADEYLVYPGCEQTGIEALCDQLEKKNLNCLATMFIDMYGGSAIARTGKKKGKDLLIDCPFFDRRGYLNFALSNIRFPRIFGGPRARLFWPEVNLRKQEKLLLSCASNAFDEAFYLAKYSDVNAAVQSGEFNSGWQHYRVHGQVEKRMSRVKEISFDETYYRATYPDVEEAIKSHLFRDGWHHYRLHGYSEGRTFRLTEPGFYEAGYRSSHPEIDRAINAGAFTDAWQHYCLYGYEEGRTFRSAVPPPDWPEKKYLSGNPDVEASIAAGVVSSGFDHYVRFGQFEGRFLDYPPLLSQIPLMKWERGMKIHAGRHIVEGARWHRSDAVGGALLHFKLMADLVDRAKGMQATGEDTSESPHWGAENARYYEVLTKNPKLRARERLSCVKERLAKLRGTEPPISVRYRDSQQLIDLGLITPTKEI